MSAAGRTRRDAASPRRRRQVPQPSSAEPSRRTRADRQRRPHRRPRSAGPVGNRQHRARSVASLHANLHQADHQGRQHLRPGTRHEEQLPIFPALPGNRNLHRGRRRSHASLLDRSLQTPDHGRSQASLRRSRQEARRSARTRHAARARRSDLRLGFEPHQPRPPARRIVRNHPHERLVAGRRRRFRACGTSTKPIARQAAAARQASATPRPARSAAHSRTASTAAFRSRSRPTAISCTLPEPCGPRLITASRCSA